MRPLTENGEWGAKQKKIYDLDENGEKIPVIDKRTGQQKVDKRNRKQWKCHTADSTDWNSKENAKMWRKDLADTINATNEQLGIALHWEHRSFKEQDIDKEPTIHIGAVANALERKGMQTERGNINREIIRNNMLLEQAKEMLMLARQELHGAQYAKIKNSAVSVKNEVMEMIAKVRERKGRLDLPIVSGKHLRRISDRTALQSADNAEKFITTRKIDSFESLAKFTADREQKYQQLETVHLSKGQKLSRLKELSKMYALYAPIQATYKESQSLKGLAKMKYDREHKDSLSKYPELKERMQSLLQNGEKITPKQWKAEIQSLQSEYNSIGREQTKTATELAYAEVISYNKKNLEREFQNESRQHNRLLEPHTVNCYVFSLVFALMGSLQGKVFLNVSNRCLPPYPTALRKSALPPLWHGHTHSWWYSRQSVPRVPARPSALHRLTAGCLYKYGGAGGSESPQIRPVSLPVSGRRYSMYLAFQGSRQVLNIQMRFRCNPPECPACSSCCKRIKSQSRSIISLKN